MDIRFWRGRVHDGETARQQVASSRLRAHVLKYKNKKRREEGREDRQRKRGRER